uniref:Uncharacterized protein n=1 Tax=Branchiostoma floridae TaxID=7739 RepID=C3YWU1_BRAFL|eukprot:XP_002599323.1 hypothetical protein BRAFLDRAFT_64322 [Branchiostoma floridae]
MDHSPLFTHVSDAMHERVGVSTPSSAQDRTTDEEASLTPFRPAERPACRRPICKSRAVDGPPFLPISSLIEDVAPGNEVIDSRRAREATSSKTIPQIVWRLWKWMTSNLAVGVISHPASMGSREIINLNCAGGSGQGIPAEMGATAC